MYHRLKWKTLRSRSLISAALLLPLLLDRAEATTVSDATQLCQLNIASGDSASVLLTRSNSKCIAQFTAVGNYTFTVPAAVSQIDYLIVAGGGGGASGGGGAGGLLQGSNYSVTPNASVTVSVGGGGSGGAGGGNSTSGSNSSLLSMNAIGGGGGAPTASSTSGGSGGGGAYDRGGTPGSATSGQGYGGGTSQFGGYGGGAGGGGAGGVGVGSPYSHIGGNGGDGIANSITGSSVYYAGGGGGGINENSNQYHDVTNGIYSSYAETTANKTAITKGGGQGGLGGGGRGSSFGMQGHTGWSNASAGAANTGSGGGGTDPEDSGGMPGGSGIVIISWVASVAPIFYSLNISGQLYKGISATMTLQINIPGKITFLANGKRIPNCSGRSIIGSSPSYSASCTWKPSTTGTLKITAQVTPNGDTTSVNSGPYAYSVVKRTNVR